MDAEGRYNSLLQLTGRMPPGAARRE